MSGDTIDYLWMLFVVMSGGVSAVNDEAKNFHFRLRCLFSQSSSKYLGGQNGGGMLEGGW